MGIISKLLLILVLLSNYAQAKNNYQELRHFFDSIESKLSENNISTLNLLKEEAVFSRAAGDSLRAAFVEYSLAKYYILNTFNYPQAINLLFRAVDNFEKLNKNYEAGKCDIQIGLIYYLQRNLIEAEHYFSSAYNRMLTTTDSIRIGRSAYLLSLTYSEQKNFKEAARFLELAEFYSSQLNNTQSNNELLYARGIFYLNYGNADSALFYLEPLLVKSINENYVPAIQRYSAHIAQAWKIKNDDKKVQHYASIVVSKNRNVSTEYHFINSYHLLYESKLKEGDYINAVDYLNKYIQLKDSVLNEKNLFELAGIKAKFELDREKRESDLLAARQLAIIEKQKTLKVIFILSGVFLLIFVFALKNKNKQLALSYDKLKSTQEKLVNQEKLASMGRLSAGIAHEMLNPLNFVKGFSAAMKEILDDVKNSNDENERTLIVADAKNLVNKVNEHSNRMESSVKQIISHIQINPGKNEWTDINQLCDLYISLVTNSLSAQQKDFNYTIIKNYSADLPKLFINTREIGRVLTNILTNSFQALDDKLKTENYTPEISIRTYLDNKIVSIEISDNGIGINNNILDKIFDDFFTTRTPGKGVGLGLSVARDIIRSYSGKVSAQSAAGLTTFRIELPTSDFRSN